MEAEEKEEEEEEEKEKDNAEEPTIAMDRLRHATFLCDCMYIFSICKKITIRVILS